MDIKIGDLVIYNGDDEACKVVEVDHEHKKLGVDAGDDCIYIWDFSDVKETYRLVN